MRLIGKVPIWLAYYVVWTALYTSTVIFLIYTEQHNALPLDPGDTPPWIFASTALCLIGAIAGTLVSTAFWLIQKAISLIPILRRKPFVPSTVASIVVACIVWYNWVRQTSDVRLASLAAAECILAGLVVVYVVDRRTATTGADEVKGRVEPVDNHTWPPPARPSDRDRHL